MTATAGISQATGYRYLYEGIDVFADQAPDLHGVLDRCRRGRVSPLWPSVRHRQAGERVQEHTVAERPVQLHRHHLAQPLVGAGTLLPPDDGRGQCTTLPSVSSTATAGPSSQAPWSAITVKDRPSLAVPASCRSGCNVSLGPSAIGSTGGVGGFKGRTAACLSGVS